MRRKTEATKPPAEQLVKDARRRLRNRHSAEKKIRILREGSRGEEGIATSLCCSCWKEHLETGKRRLTADTARQVSNGTETGPRIGAQKGPRSLARLDAALTAPQP